MEGGGTPNSWAAPVLQRATGGLGPVPSPGWVGLEMGSEERRPEFRGRSASLHAAPLLLVPVLTTEQRLLLSSKACFSFLFFLFKQKPSI